MIFVASSLPIHEIALAIWSAVACGPMVAIDSMALSMAQAARGAALAPIPVDTGPGRIAFERIPLGE